MHRPFCTRQQGYLLRLESITMSIDVLKLVGGSPILSGGGWVRFQWSGFDTGAAGGLQVVQHMLQTKSCLMRQANNIPMMHLP